MRFHSGELLAVRRVRLLNKLDVENYIRDPFQTPGRVISRRDEQVMPLHDIGMSFHIGMRISLWYSDRGELAPVLIFCVGIM